VTHSYLTLSQVTPEQLVSKLSTPSNVNLRVPQIGTESAQLLQKQQQAKSYPDKNQLLAAKKEIKIDNNNNNNTENEESFSDLDEDEMETYLNTEDEIKMKSEIWHEVNREYVEKLAEKEKLEAENANNPDKIPKPVRKRKKSLNGPADTAAEATFDVLKKKTNKINYNVLQNLLSWDEKTFDAKTTHVEKLEDTSRNLAQFFLAKDV
jgi:hypothetical protein